MTNVQQSHPEKKSDIGSEATEELVRLMEEARGLNSSGLITLDRLFELGLTEEIWLPECKRHTIEVVDEVDQLAAAHGFEVSGPYFDPGPDDEGMDYYLLSPAACVDRWPHNVLITVRAVDAELANQSFSNWLDNQGELLVEELEGMEFQGLDAEFRLLKVRFHNESLARTFVERHGGILLSSKDVGLLIHAGERLPPDFKDRSFVKACAISIATPAM